MADRPQDPPRYAGHVVRRMLLRNIAVDPETAQLVACRASLAERRILQLAEPGRHGQVAATCSSGVVTAARHG